MSDPIFGETVPALLRRLLADHRRLLPALQNWAESLSSPARGTARERLEGLASQLRTHARIEEETLFQAMADILGSSALAGYEMQHDDIDEVLEELLATQDGLPQNATELAERLLWYCESHFEIEEKHIFREALQRLTSDQWQALNARADQLAAAGPAS